MPTGTRHQHAVLRRVYRRLRTGNVCVRRQRRASHTARVLRWNSKPNTPSGFRDGLLFRVLSPHAAVVAHPSRGPSSWDAQLGSPRESERSSASLGRHNRALVLAPRRRRKRGTKVPDAHGLAGFATRANTKRTFKMFDAAFNVSFHRPPKARITRPL